MTVLDPLSDSQWSAFPSPGLISVFEGQPGMLRRNTKNPQMGLFGAAMRGESGPNVMKFQRTTTLNTRYIAVFATRYDYFALAQKAPLPHLEQAFQASSPKTFKPRPQWSGLFYCLVSGRLGTNRQAGGLHRRA